MSESINLPIWLIVFGASVVLIQHVLVGWQMRYLSKILECLVTLRERAAIDAALAVRNGEPNE